MHLAVNDLAYLHAGTTFSAEFERINVIMGANGAGKSRLLQAIAQNLVARGFQSQSIYVEGGRATQIDVNVGLDGQSIDLFSNPIREYDNYISNRSSSLNSRSQRSIRILRALEQARKASHSDAVHAWIEKGKIDDFPSREKMPLDQFFGVFNAIFPEITLEITSENQVFCRKGGAHYPVSVMSDGERQIFLLSADLLSFRAANQVFLIDEPELNLHPSLAEKFWTQVESEIEDATFIYATHSLSFAARDGVEKITVLGYGNLNINDLHLHHDQLRPFLGSYPKIESSKRCVLVEGDDSSIDTPLYKWISGQDDLSIVAIGGSREVELAAARLGLWRGLSDRIRLVGIVDRDFKQDGIIATNCIILPFHEAESLLIHPDVIISIQVALGNLSNRMSRDDMITQIVDEATRRKNFVVLRRCFERLSIRLSVSLDRGTLSAVSSASEGLSLVIKAAKLELEKAQILSEESKIERIFDEENKRCEIAVEERNVDELLTLFEGKRLAHKMANIAGCPNPIGPVRAIKKHLNPIDFSFLKAIRKDIQQI